MLKLSARSTATPAASFFRLARLLCLGMASMAALAASAEPPPPASDGVTGDAVMQKKSADLVLLNGAIYTVDRARSWAQALAVANGKILFVGSNAGARSFIDEKTKVIDLNGKMVMPGLHDSHVHLIDGGLDMATCQLGECKDREAILSKVKDYVQKQSLSQASNGQVGWIRGSGWALPSFSGGNPRKEDLDAISKDVPIWLESQDYHSGWANSRALQLCGITRDTADPSGGLIERDSRTGEPSGTLRESAMLLVSKKIPPREQSEYTTALERAQQLANSLGITSIQDPWTKGDHLKAYGSFDANNRLTVKVTAAMEVKQEDAEAEIQELLNLRKLYEGAKKFKLTSAKLFADGVLEARTAALLEPYSDRRGQSGKLLFDPDKMKQIVERLDKENIQVHVHAIGDKAVRTTLDAFQHTLEKNGNIDRRHHIAHLEMIDKDDMGRFAKLFVAANVQSFWAFNDPYVRMTVPRVGKKRAAHLYPIGSLALSGAVLVGGSDWPVSSLSPFDAIEVAVRRCEPGNPKSKAWLPLERASLCTMLDAYTINGAFIQHHETETGSLEVGKAADLIVVDQNLFVIKPELIHKTKILLTLLDGQPVYKSDHF